MVSSRYIIIVGCGRLGSILANRLSALGHSVVVIDRQEAAFHNLSTEFSGFRITGDAVELSVLRSAKAGKADCLLVSTEEDNVNLMIAQVAGTVFDIPTVVARVYDPSREAIFQEFGIKTICPTKLSAEAFLQSMSNEPAGAR